MTVRVKICGNTRLEDVRLAVSLGAHAVGFIFYPPSPRSADPEVVAEIVRELPPFVTTVGVFVDESVENINRTVGQCRLDHIQLHGNEPYGMLAELARPAYRVFRLRDEDDLARLNAEPDATVLLDTYDANLAGGTGRAFDWGLARRAGESKQVILAGGLNAGNISEAIETARPAAVDLASALEATPGVKDPAKLETFFYALKGHLSHSPHLTESHASAS